MPLPKVLKSQGFTLALIGAVIAAILLPEPGARGGLLKSEVTSKVLVAITFLIQGLSLPTQQILKSAAKAKLHLYCLICNFALAPLLMLGLLAIVGGSLLPGIHTGAIYLAVLPATISSAIIMTGNADGDSSSALFATTASNVLGVFMTPILCSLLLQTSSSGEIGSLGPLIAKLSQLVLLPLAAGQILRRFIAEWASRSKPLFKKVSNGAIVFIVYAAFCNSVLNGIWEQVNLSTILLTLLIVIAFLVVFSCAVWFASPLATKEVPERIAAFFCGSQKTLAAGVPMASVIFASQGTESAQTGLILLPIMCYHPLQLLLAGFLTPVLSKKAAAQ
ncbi:MAG: bile acid:sodium symporter [Symploca sp. SIO2D2]|nr:bile acid:sodium symporter [Symploca sp. SIO2D2]